MTRPSAMRVVVGGSAASMNKTVQPSFGRGKSSTPFGGWRHHLRLRSSVGRQKESALMGRLGALFRPTCTSYAGCAQWTIKPLQPGFARGKTSQTRFARWKTIQPRLWRVGNAPLLPTAPPPEGNAIKLRILQIFSNRKLLRACGFIMQQNHNKSSHIFNKNY